MKLIEFTSHFPDQHSCRIAFKKYRKKEGLKCKKCDNTHHYWKKKREQWECKECGYTIG